MVDFSSVTDRITPDVVHGGLGGETVRKALTETTAPRIEGKKIGVLTPSSQRGFFAAHRHKTM